MAAAVGTEVGAAVPQLPPAAEQHPQQVRRLVERVPLRLQALRLAEREPRRHQLPEEQRRLVARRRRLAVAGPGALVVAAAVAVAGVMRPATQTRTAPLTPRSSRSLATPTVCRR